MLKLQKATIHTRGSYARISGEVVREMGDGGPNGLQHLREQRSSSQQMVPLGQRISYLINAFRTDDSLDTEPEHGEDNEADDTEIAKPESE